MTVIVVAGVAVAINLATALLVMCGRDGDLNVRAAFTHMAEVVVESKRMDLTTSGVKVAALRLMDKPPSTVPDAERFLRAARAELARLHASLALAREEVERSKAVLGEAQETVRESRTKECPRWAGFSREPQIRGAG